MSQTWEFITACRQVSSHRHLGSGDWAAKAAPGAGLEGARLDRPGCCVKHLRRPGCEEQFAFPIRDIGDTLVSDSVCETLESSLGFLADHWREAVTLQGGLGVWG